MLRPHNSFVSITLLAFVGVLTAGCFNGQNAQTSQQVTEPTGNGAQVTVEAIRVDNATLVAGPNGSNSATLLVRIVNQGNDVDTLVGAEVGGEAAFITNESTELLPGSSISFGFNSDLWINAYDFDSEVSSYVPVSLTFEKSGDADLSVLVVPATGYYEGIAPEPPVA